MVFWKKKHRPTEIEKIKEKIRQEYPELTVAHKGHIEPLFNQIKTYYEINGIKSQKWSNRINIVLAILIIILTTVNLYFVIISLQSSNPHISLYTSNVLSDIEEISAQRLVEKRFLPGDNLELCIKNDGRIETGRITLFLNENWAYSTIWNFDNIDSGRSKCLSEFIRQRNTNRETDGNLSQIPKGIVNLHFDVVCNNCEPRIFEKIVEVCIWSGNNSICNIS